MSAQGGLHAAPRVVVVEDNEFFRRGLVRVLDRHGIQVAGEAASGEEALEVVGAVRPQAVLMDLHLPGMDGAEATARLMERPTPPVVVVLTVSARDEDLQRALHAGAVGYLLKDASGAEIAEGIGAAVRGDSPMSAAMTRKLVDRFRHLPPEPSRDGELLLSERELAVLRLVARGRDNNAIAAALAISPHTVKNHVSAVLEKLGVENRVQAATEAVRRGFI
jgi:DNA-binding NarL/FixJ family response regulator